LPDGKFATVSFTFGGYAVQPAYVEDNKSPKESYFKVDSGINSIESD